ncbi:hypothetical protein PVAP13_8KG251100 [Panicum virgatum]|uniref:Uncharacterized protein n=1 Tax=Panicum virgatum TaxID=38727 RepID=A0A8T0PNW3_PANVG|nr:hypothetical protein PVAP13_8KG251100 [Panicum virgatum]
MRPRLSSVGPPVPCRSPPSKPLVSLIVPPPSSCGCVGPAPACLPCLSPPPARPFFLLSLPTIKVRNGRGWSPLGQNLLRKSKTKTGDFELGACSEDRFLSWWRGCQAPLDRFTRPYQELIYKQMLLPEGIRIIAYTRLQIYWL